MNWKLLSWGFGGNIRDHGVRRRNGGSGERVWEGMVRKESALVMSSRRKTHSETMRRSFMVIEETFWSCTGESPSLETGLTANWGSVWCTIGGTYYKKIVYKKMVSKNYKKMVYKKMVRKIDISYSLVYLHYSMYRKYIQVYGDFLSKLQANYVVIH